VGLWLLQRYPVPDLGVVAATRSERREHIAVTQGHGAWIPATPAHRLDLLRPDIGMVVEDAGGVGVMATVGEHAPVLQHDVVAAE